METAKEWLEELPEPYRSQALTNMKNDVPYTGDIISKSLSYAVLAAFDWDNTHEGANYWIDLQEELLNNELN